MILEFNTQAQPTGLVVGMLDDDFGRKILTGVTTSSSLEWFDELVA